MYSAISSGPGHVEGELNLSKRSITDNSNNNKQLWIQQQDGAESYQAQLTLIRLSLALFPSSLDPCSITTTKLPTSIDFNLLIFWLFRLRFFFFFLRIALIKIRSTCCWHFSLISLKSFGVLAGTTQSFYHLKYLPVRPTASPSSRPPD